MQKAPYALKEKTEQLNHPSIELILQLENQLIKLYALFRIWYKRSLKHIMDNSLLTVCEC